MLAAVNFLICLNTNVSFCSNTQQHSIMLQKKAQQDPGSHVGFRWAVKVWATFSKFLLQLLIRSSEQVCCKKSKWDGPKKTTGRCLSARKPSGSEVNVGQRCQKNTVVEKLTWAEWGGRGVILQSKALPAITVTVSWTSGISSVSSPSQLCSCTHRRHCQTPTRATDCSRYVQSTCKRAMHATTSDKNSTHLQATTHVIARHDGLVLAMN